MAEQVQAVQEQVTPEVEPTTEVVKNDVPKIDDKVKAELTGLNRRNSELEKLLQERNEMLETVKKERMADDERRVYELEQRENEVTAAKQELLKTSNKEKAMRIANEFGVPIDLLDTLTFDNWEVVEGNLNKLKSVFSDYKQRTIDEIRTQAGHTPHPDGGTVPTKLTREDLKHMSPEEISKAADEGRIPGVGSPR